MPEHTEVLKEGMKGELSSVHLSWQDAHGTCHVTDATHQGKINHRSRLITLYLYQVDQHSILGIL